MRSWALVLLGLAGLYSQGSAQQATTADTAFASGTPARFWSPRYRYWMEGSIVRFYPGGNQSMCTGVFAEAIGGFVRAVNVDSLQVAATPGASPSASAGNQATNVTWLWVSLPALRARERDCRD